VRSYWRSLRTKQAAASPFHCCLVSPGSKKAFLRALRTMLTTGVSPKFEIRSVIAVTGVGVLPLRDLLSILRVCPSLPDLSVALEVH